MILSCGSVPETEFSRIIFNSDYFVSEEQQAEIIRSMEEFTRCANEVNSDAKVSLDFNLEYNILHDPSPTCHNTVLIAGCAWVFDNGKAQITNAVDINDELFVCITQHELSHIFYAIFDHGRAWDESCDDFVECYSEICGKNPEPLC